MARKRRFVVEVPWATVEVTLRRTSRVTVRAHRDGTVSASVPLGCSKDQAERALLSLDAAAVERLLSVLPDPATTEALDAYLRLRDGDTVQVWGEPRTVLRRPVPFGERPRATLGAGTVTLWCRPEDEAGPNDEARALFEGLLRAELQEALPEAKARAEQKVGAPTGSWTVRRMTSRWGSCRYETGRISINLDLATHDRAFLDLVAVHETCHMVAHDHGPEFQALMDRCLPGWRDGQRRLDEEGVRLPRRAPGSKNDRP